MLWHPADIVRRPVLAVLLNPFVDLSQQHARLEEVMGDLAIDEIAWDDIA
jgi:hypothetical protein